MSHSFPTRRSSDLLDDGADAIDELCGHDRRVSHHNVIVNWPITLSRSLRAEGRTVLALRRLLLGFEQRENAAAAIVTLGIVACRHARDMIGLVGIGAALDEQDRKSTRLKSSH